MILNGALRLVAEKLRVGAGTYLNDKTGYDWVQHGTSWVAQGVSSSDLKRLLDLKAKGGHWVSGDPQLTIIKPKTIYYFCVSFNGDSARGYYTEVDHED